MRLRAGLTAVALCAFALAACSNERDGESAEEFAERVGDGGAAPAPVETTAVAAPIPAGVDATTLEQLGNIAGVDLGPRDGACTFASGGTELMIAAAPNGVDRPGRAVVRAGGTLYQLASTGGLDAVRRGTRFTGQGITVDVAGAGQSSALTVTDAAGKAKTFPGSWMCA
jgi:hypothetical protein